MFSKLKHGLTDARKRQRYVGSVLLARKWQKVQLIKIARLLPERREK